MNALEIKKYPHLFRSAILSLTTPELVNWQKDKGNQEKHTIYRPIRNCSTDFLLLLLFYFEHYFDSLDLLSIFIFSSSRPSKFPEVSTTEHYQFLRYCRKEILKTWILTISFDSLQYPSQHFLKLSTKQP